MISYCFRYKAFFVFLEEKYKNDNETETVQCRFGLVSCKVSFTFGQTLDMKLKYLLSAFSRLNKSALFVDHGIRTILFFFLATTSRV